MRLKTLILFSSLLFCLLMKIGAATADEDDGCDEKAEAAREAEMRACGRKKARSEKTWKSKEDALKFIKENFPSKPDKLLPYLGCEAEDITRRERICWAETPKLGRKDLEESSRTLKLSSKTFEKARWVERTKDKGVFLLCSDDIDLHAAWNPCAEEKSTPFPIIEIIKGEKGFYITGVPLHF
jgi:hypothetical protein